MIMATEVPDRFEMQGFFGFFVMCRTNLQADYIALSFVQCAADIVECRTAFDKFQKGLKGELLWEPEKAPWKRKNKQTDQQFVGHIKLHISSQGCILILSGNILIYPMIA